ncbi:MAG: xanthine/CO dehydrogenase XdhC/CoxF family maturation factor [Ilumatobacter sp.]
MTDVFWPQGDSVAASAGMPDIPRLRLPHPVAGSGHAAMAEVAASIVAQVVAVLRGEVVPDNVSQGIG